ncbi:MAG TPA: lytic transglycosylase domain-containing protein [Methyloversatilis sp.]
MKTTLLLLTILLTPACSQADVYARQDEGGTLHLTDTPIDAGFQLLLDTGTERAPVSARGTQRHPESIARASQASGIDARLLSAVIAVESAHDTRAVSPKGAAGLMQLMPDTARRYGVRDRFDPDQNVMGGALYLRDLMQRFDNRLELVLAAYNAGESAVERHGRKIPPYAETRRYVPRVLGHYRAPY